MDLQKEMNFWLNSGPMLWASLNDNVGSGGQPCFSLYGEAGIFLKKKETKKESEREGGDRQRESASKLSHSV